MKICHETTDYFNCGFRIHLLEVASELIEEQVDSSGDSRTLRSDDNTFHGCN